MSNWVAWQPCGPGEWTAPGVPVGYGRGLFGRGPFGGEKKIPGPYPTPGIWRQPGDCADGTWTTTGLAA